MTNPGYSELKDLLEDLPMTWYPALLVAMTQAAVAKGVFQPGGAGRLVTQAEANARTRQAEAKARAENRCPACGSTVSLPGTGAWFCTNPACRYASRIPPKP